MKQKQEQEQDYTERGDELTRTRFPRVAAGGVAFGTTFATLKGSQLLQHWDSYYALAKAGQGSFDALEAAVRTLGLILLDAEDRQRKPEGPQTSAGGKEEVA